MEWSHSLDIGAPAEVVWALTLEVESLPTISPSTMTAVSRVDSGPLAAGSRVRVKQPGQPERVWTVTTVEAPTRFVWETTVAGARMVATHVVAPVDAGCRNTLSITLTGAGSRLWGRLLGRPVRTALAAENAGFKLAAERDQSDRS